jgi:hypothetical protein
VSILNHRTSWLLMGRMIVARDMPIGASAANRA